VTDPIVRVSTFAGPGANPVIREVPRPQVPARAALIRIAACGVCGTDLHILNGHWPTPLPWPFTLGHELAGVVVEIGEELTKDFMGHTLQVGSKVILPPLMPCGECFYCVHYPETANKCLAPVYYGRYLGFDRPPHLWGGWADAARTQPWEHDTITCVPREGPFAIECETTSLIVLTSLTATVRSSDATIPRTDCASAAGSPAVRAMTYMSCGAPLRTLTTRCANGR